MSVPAKRGRQCFVRTVGPLLHESLGFALYTQQVVVVVDGRLTADRHTRRREWQHCRVHVVLPKLHELFDTLQQAQHHQVRRGGAAHIVSKHLHGHCLQRCLHVRLEIGVGEYAQKREGALRHVRRRAQVYAAAKCLRVPAEHALGKPNRQLALLLRRRRQRGIVLQRCCSTRAIHEALERRHRCSGTIACAVS